MGFNIAHKRCPFTLSLLILGGAGSIEALGEYYPLSGRVSARFEVSIYLSGVFAYMGYSAPYLESTREKSSSLRITAGFLLRGEVPVCGLVSISIALSLEVFAEADGAADYLGARGELSVELEICWCFTISISVAVEYRFKVSDKAPKLGFINDHVHALI